MIDPQETLQPFEMSVRERAAAAQRRARGVALIARLGQAKARAEESAARLRARMRRARFEIGATARSSATIAGVSRDLGRASRGLQNVATSDTGAVASVRRNLGRVQTEIREDFGRLRKELPGEARRVAGAIRHDLGLFPKELPGEISRLDKDLRGNLAALRKEVKVAEKRTKTALMHSSTVSGLAIDSKRVVRKVKEVRQRRKLRTAH